MASEAPTPTPPPPRNTQHAHTRASPHTQALTCLHIPDMLLGLDQQGTPPSCRPPPGWHLLPFTRQVQTQPCPETAPGSPAARQPAAGRAQPLTSRPSRLGSPHPQSLWGSRALPGSRARGQTWPSFVAARRRGGGGRTEEGGDREEEIGAL